MLNGACNWNIGPQPMPIEFNFYTGLDQPWLAPFGTEWTRQLIARLGMDEATVLSHPTLHRANRSAQQRLTQ